MGINEALVPYVEPKEKKRYLSQVGAKLANYEFSLSGVGEFPSHLLYKLSCWPQCEDSGLEIYSKAAPDVHRTVNIISTRPPNADAWGRYGWSVSRQSPAIEKDDYSAYHTWPA